jgi:ribonuclease Z
VRRILVTLVALVAVVGALAWTFRAPLALRAFHAALTRTLTGDPIAALPDGLHVVLCGAGGPLPDPQRSGPCTAVVAGRTLFVVDAGTGGARNLQRLGVPPGQVAAVFLTHFHSDHIDGLGELGLLRWAGGAHAEPLPVYGPEGVRDVVRGFDRAYAADARYRTAHHGPEVVPPSGAGLAAHPFPTPQAGEPIVVHDAEGVRVTAFRVDHQPVDPAVGYRFDYAGRSVVVSGDTRKSDEVERNAHGADLLVHEALATRLVAVMTEAASQAGRPNLAKIASDIPSYHTSPVEAAELAQAAGVGHLLFYHVVPPLLLPGMESVFLEGVADAYAGPVTVGRDGTMVSLPAGSDAIDVSQR